MPTSPDVSVAAEPAVLRFYRHDTVKGEIDSSLEKARKILSKAGLSERMSLKTREGDNGELYGIDRRLFIYRKEFSEAAAQLLHVYADTTNGQAGYLSAVLKGEYDPKIVKLFEEADFAPGHSYLAKDDRILGPNFGKTLKWIDDFVEFENPLVDPK